VLPLRDVQGLGERIVQLMKDRPAACKMGERGRALVTADWDVATMVQRISDLYKQLLLRKGITFEPFS